MRLIDTTDHDTIAHAEQPMLPIDVDAPIAFEMTARAKREVAPATVTPLRIVRSEPQVDDDSPSRSRARALRRGGAPLARIAADLGIDEAVLATWVADLGPAPAGIVALHPSGRSATPPLADVVPIGAAQAIDRAREDGSFAVGLALVAAHAEVTPHAVVVNMERLDLAARVISWLLVHTDVSRDHIRVVLRVPPHRSPDLVRARFRRITGLESSHVTVSTRSDVEGVIVRVSDRVLVGKVLGWQEAMDVLLGSHDS